MIEYTDFKGGSSRHSIFDTDRMTKMLAADAGRAPALLGILTNVLANGSTPISEARKAFLRKQPAQAAHVIHNLKGCISNLGGQRVFQVANILEPKLEAGVDENEVNQLLDQLDYELSAYLKAARTWLNGNYAPHQQVTPASHSQLQLLKQYLLDCNFLACDVFEALRPTLKNMLPTEEYLALNKAMDAMNFTQAIAHLACVIEPTKPSF